MTYTVSGETTIDSPKASVWEVLSDLETVQSYDSGVTKAFYVSKEREGVGAARHCDLPDGTYVRERIVDWREGEGYTINVYDDGTEFPMSDQTAEFTLQDSGEGTRVTMTYRYSLKSGMAVDAEETTQMAHEIVSGVLAGLKAFAEAGEQAAVQA